MGIAEEAHHVLRVVTWRKPYRFEKSMGSFEITSTLTDEAVTVTMMAKVVAPFLHNWTAFVHNCKLGEGESL